MWPEEASNLISEGRSLRELSKVGPWLAQTIEEWFEDPPKVPKPDPLREGFITFAAARAIVADHPDWEKELRSDLQMHTEYSDGRDSIAQMAAAASEYGYEYIAVTDHSKGLKIAGGMQESELVAQLAEIDGINADYSRRRKPFRVLKALEMNINPRGEGDMDPESLEPLDLVLGSFHSSLRTKDDQTARYLAAMRNPHFNVLGHPRGRVYNFRAGLQTSWMRVFEEGAAQGKAIEINSYPDRQDLNIDLLEIARESGVNFSIGTDAHNPWELQFIWIAVAAAITAAIPRDRIINYWPRERLIEWAKR